MKRAKQDPEQIKMLLAEKEANWRYQKIVTKVLKREGVRLDEIHIASLIELAEHGGEIELEFSGKVVVNEKLTTTEREDQSPCQKPKRKMVYYHLDLKKQDGRMRYKLQEITYDQYQDRKGVYIKNEE